MNIYGNFRNAAINFFKHFGKKPGVRGDGISEKIRRKIPAGSVSAAAAGTSEEEKKETKEPPDIRLSVVRGSADFHEYRIRKKRILIGLTREVMDSEGRVIRKNDVAFTYAPKEEINSTVSLTHARIWFESEEQAFFIMDEGSRYGTWIERQGHTIEVSAGDPSGNRLQSGDEICCGQARLRFELP
ncbi:MAG TPA: FHA domain-containing protein [Acidobacteriota bacterium]|nr:FHA domain-containing protein [Acidobacteriota bacterium]